MAELDIRCAECGMALVVKESATPSVETREHYLEVEFCEKCQGNIHRMAYDAGFVAGKQAVVEEWEDA